jgi:hypothetical protein
MANEFMRSFFGRNKTFQALCIREFMAENIAPGPDEGPYCCVRSNRQTRRRELYVFFSMQTNNMRIMRYEIPWDDPGDVARDAAIERARREHGCR